VLSSLSSETTHKCLKSLTTDIADIRQDFSSVVTHNDDRFSLIADKLQSVERKLHDINVDMRSSKNGSLLWRVSDFNELVERSQDDHELCVCSEFVYTGVYGYKIQFRLYPFGLGLGEGTHMSLYVVLYKTEHDILLQWPFQQKVKVKLLNMNELASKRKHHIVTIGPDRYSSSFVRPIHDHNPGWGFPKFISHHDLQRNTFLRENNLFIKLLIEPYDAMDVHKQSYD